MSVPYCTEPHRFHRYFWALFVLWKNWTLLNIVRVWFLLIKIKINDCAKIIKQCGMISYDMVRYRNGVKFESSDYIRKNLSKGLFLDLVSLLLIQIHCFFSKMLITRQKLRDLPTTLFLFLLDKKILYNKYYSISYRCLK